MSVAVYDVFSHSSWLAAELAACAALAEHDRLLLLGAPGTGKTLLLNTLARRLRLDGITVRVPQPCDLQEDWPETDVLLIDEACALSEAELERLCRLPNRLILAGLPRLRERMSRTVGLIGSVTLQPLSAEEVARFIAVRLAAAKRSATSFTADAVSAVAQHSEGLFRPIVILAGAALFFADLRGAPQVTEDDVGEAACMRSSIADEAQDAPAAVTAETTAVPRARGWPVAACVSAIVLISVWLSVSR